MDGYDDFIARPPWYTKGLCADDLEADDLEKECCLLLFLAPPSLRWLKAPISQAAEAMQKLVSLWSIATYLSSIWSRSVLYGK